MHLSASVPLIASLSVRHFLGSVLLAGTAALSTRANPPEPLTLRQALERTAQLHPALAAAAFHERAAAALTEQAGQRPNPTLEVGVENLLGTGAAQGVRSLEATVQASQTFERGDKREKRVALASRERELVGRELAVRRTELQAATAAAYLAAVTAQARHVLAADEVRLARETLATVEARVRAAAASPVEAARARAALAAAVATQAHLANEATAARTALAATWGGRPDEVRAVSGSLQVPADLPPADDLRRPLSTHPRLEVPAAQVAARRAALDLEQAQAVPDVTASGGLRFLREGSDAAFVTGVSLPLPVRHRNQGGIRAAREALSGAEQSVRATDAELQVAFDGAWQELVTAHSAAQRLRGTVLPASEEAAAAVRRAHEAGALPLTDVLDAERAIVAVRRELLEAGSGYATALTRLAALADPAYTTVTALLGQ